MAALSLILYYACPDTPNHVTAATVLAKMYSNSVLAIFNSRIRIIGGRDEYENGANVLLSLHPGTQKMSGPNTDSCVTGSQPSAIRIQEDIYVHTDNIPLEMQVRYYNSDHQNKVYLQRAKDSILGKKKLSFGSDEQLPAR